MPRIWHKDPPPPEDDGIPSKTQRKHEMHALQDLGERLAELTPDRLGQLELPERLATAITEYRRFNKWEAKRRQMQYIGKLMRGVDTAPIRQAVLDMQLGRAKDSLSLHEAERWRAELVAADDALDRWAQSFPASDLQQLRSLVRAARADATLAAGERHGRAWRALYQFVKPFVAQAATYTTPAP